MTFEPRMIFCVIVGLLVCEGLVEADTLISASRSNGRFKRRTRPMAMHDEATNPEATDYWPSFQTNSELRYDWNLPRPWLYNPLSQPFNPVFFHDFPRKRDDLSIGTNSVNLPNFNERLLAKNNDLHLRVLREQLFSENFVKKRLPPNLRSNNLLKRFPYEAYARRAPYFSHSFVGKRASYPISDTRSIALKGSTSYGYSHSNIEKRSASAISHHTENIDTQSSDSEPELRIAEPGKKQNALPDLSYIAGSKPFQNSDDSLAKRAPRYGHSFVGKRRPVQGISLVEDTMGSLDYSTDLDGLYTSDVVQEHPEIPMRNSLPEEQPSGNNLASYNQSSIEKRPRYGHSFVGKREDDPVHISKEKRPRYGHSFVGKREDNVDQISTEKRPRYGHSFVGKRDNDITHIPQDKRPRYGHSFVGKREDIVDQSSIDKRPRYGHSFVGKREDIVDQSSLDKRPRYGHSFVGKREDIVDQSSIDKRPRYGHSFVGKREDIVDQSSLDKRPRYGHSFVGKREDIVDQSSIDKRRRYSFVGKRDDNDQKSLEKRPRYGHSFVGKREDNVDHSSTDKRPRYGHSFVGKRDEDVINIPLEKRPRYGHSFVGKREDNDQTFLEKRPRYGHSFVGKRENIDQRSIEKRPRYGHSFVGKREDNDQSSVEKRPRYGHSFVGKREDNVDLSFTDKRPRYGHSFVGKREVNKNHSSRAKRPSYGHSFVGKREDIDQSSVEKRHRYGHSFVGKREDTDQNSLEKRPRYGHSFIGKREDNVDYSLTEKRPRYGHSFVGKREDIADHGHRFLLKRDEDFFNIPLDKRPRYGHSFVGKRPRYGHSFVGKRDDDVLQSLLDKRPRYGHSFVGKREDDVLQSLVDKRPRYGHSFVGKRPRYGHSFIGKRQNVGHSYIGKYADVIGNDFVEPPNGDIEILALRKEDHRSPSNSSLPATGISNTDLEVPEIHSDTDNSITEENRQVDKAEKLIKLSFPHTFIENSPNAKQVQYLLQNVIDQLENDVTSDERISIGDNIESEHEGKLDNIFNTRDTAGEDKLFDSNSKQSKNIHL